MEDDKYEYESVPPWFAAGIVITVNLAVILFLVFIRGLFE